MKSHSSLTSVVSGLLSGAARVTLAAMLLASCGGKKQQSGNTFYYNESDGLNTLDPAKIGARAPWWIGGQIYIGLVGLDTAMHATPPSMIVADAPMRSAATPASRLPIGALPTNAIV